MRRNDGPGFLHRVSKPTMALIDRLLHALANAPPRPGLYNPWREQDGFDLHADAVRQRRSRLCKHFDTKPRVILIGESPGYQGARYSGIPFTSERLLCEGLIPRIESCPRLTSRARPFSEPSATIVWGTAEALGVAEQMILWNAQPFHPMKPGQPLSNRTPTAEELEAGMDILQMVLQLHSGARVVAVGQKAHRSLTQLGCRFTAIRHPAYGGAGEFAAGLGSALGRRRRPD